MNQSMIQKRSILPYKVTGNVITIPLHKEYSDPHHYACLAWQKLFDIYRANKGDLAKMSDMLCDFTALLRYFSNNPGGFMVYWHFDGSHTEMTDNFIPYPGNMQVIEFYPQEGSIRITEIELCP